MSATVHPLLTHAQECRLQARVVDLENRLTDAIEERDLLRQGKICLLHQLAAAKEWKARATLWAIVAPLVAVLALRWLA